MFRSVLSKNIIPSAYQPRMYNLFPLLTRVYPPIAYYRNGSKHIYKYKAILSSSFLFFSYFLFKENQNMIYLDESNDYDSVKSVKAIRAEELYLDTNYKRKDLLEYLIKTHSEDSSDVEITWRLARAYYDVAQLKETSLNDKKKLIYSSLDIIKKSLENDQDNYAVQKWMGIILTSIGDYEGTKVSISNSIIIRNHWIKATELNPNDPTSFHLLGRCRSMAIADISWIERKIAATIFTSPPNSSYEEALKYFEHAESLSPGFWKKNEVLLGKCLLKLGEKERAKEWLLKSMAISCDTEDDINAHKEAIELLKVL